MVLPGGEGNNPEDTADFTGDVNNGRRKSVQSENPRRREKGRIINGFKCLPDANVFASLM